MHEKVNGWLDVAERILNLIRPKAYNTIAKAVVLTGIGLIVESQVNFLHAVVVALFEEYIGKSEILRSVLNASSDPTVGVLLALTGMMYHVAVTLGKEYIEIKKADLPRFPSLSCIFFDAESNAIESSSYTLKGKRVSLPDVSKIPDYFDPDTNRAHIQALALASPISGMKKANKELYRERAEVLRKWGGAEVFCVQMLSTDKVLASEVSLSLKVPKSKGLYISTLREKLPPFPLTEKSEVPPWLLMNRQPEKFSDDITIDSDVDFISMHWNIGTIQANTSKKSNNYFIINTLEKTTITGTIYCNEFAEPRKFELIVEPTPEQITIPLDALKQTDTFIEVYDESVIDGFPKREFSRKRKELEERRKSV